jgi:hypothetical protein
MKTKKPKVPIEFFTLDLTDAILPKAWPSDIPLLLKLQTGQHEKKYDIVANDEPWYQSLLKFVAKNQYTTKDDTLPVGMNGTSMHIGAKVYDANQKLVDQGKNKKLHLQEVLQKSHDLEQTLIPLREKFLGIKDKYLIEFNETQESLLKCYRPILNKQTASEVFSDILLSGGGSTYQDGTLASLGAYSSVIDFNTLKCTLDLFEKEELKLLGEDSENFAYLTPIHSVINGQIQARLEKTNKPKMK